MAGVYSKLRASVEVVARAKRSDSSGFKRWVPVENADEDLLLVSVAGV